MRSLTDFRALLVATVVACGPGCSFNETGLTASDGGPPLLPTDGPVVAIDAASRDGATQTDAPVQDDGPAIVDAPVDDAPLPSDANVLDYCTAANVAACYLFSDDLADRSGNNNNASGSGYTFAPGIVGTSLQVDTSSRVVVPESASLDISPALTIEAWVYPDALPSGGARTIIIDNDRQYSMQLFSDTTSTGIIRCSLSGGALESPANAVAIGTWTHIACVYDGTTMTVYKDGLSVASQALNRTINTSGNDGSVIGANSPCGSSPCSDAYSGRIDRLRILNVARSGDDICRDANGLNCN